MRTFATMKWIALLAALASRGAAQMHRVTKPETVVRAVGVYEWTGELAKPAASRLVPVTLYIDRHLEDAGVYLARPVPFTLQTGTIYELDEAGVVKGNLDLEYARRLQLADAAGSYDESWFGYGTYKALAAPKRVPARKLSPARTVGVETASSATDKPADKRPDADRPRFSNKPASDPAKPTDDQDTASASSTKDTTRPPDAGATKSATDDADRPTMRRRQASGTTDTTDTAAPTKNTTVDADDAERPTLKRRPVEDSKKKSRDDQAGVTGPATSLNQDPDRPSLHRGIPAKVGGEAAFPTVASLPADLRQMVAVSDAANRPVHDFARPWEDDAERAAVLAAMQSIAQAQLAGYGVTVPAAPVSPRAKRPDSKRRALSPIDLNGTPLLDEQLRGYSLSYGDVPTFVYEAHTGGTGGALRYVTVVAQKDAQNEPRIVLGAVTDAAHLDRTPRMRLVDAVDVDASNRASLLFELRGQTARQFAVYRLLGFQAERTFSTGTMP